jgi:gliding motility-associated lipoprotein GldH
MKTRDKLQPCNLGCIFILIMSIFLSFQGCRRIEFHDQYHRFPEKIWKRFEILSFEIPVTNVDKPYNLYMYTCFSNKYRYDDLHVNVIINTSAGEERIHEFQMEVRSKTGSLLGEYKNDSCQITMLLKKELKLSKPGILKIDIENLIPRTETEGVLGSGIRIVQSGK